MRSLSHEEIESIVNKVLQMVKTADAVVLAEAIKDLANVIAKNVERLEEHLQKTEERLEKIEEDARLHREYMENMVKAIHDLQRTMSIIGYRYGVYTEEVFRSSVKYFVEDLLKTYSVEKWRYYDEHGYVYGYPSIIDVDVLIKNSEHIIVVYKAHADCGDVAELYRIAQLYERVTGIKPKAILVAPTVTLRAKELAEKQGIEVRGTVVD